MGDPTDDYPPHKKPPQRSQIIRGGFLLGGGDYIYIYIYIHIYIYICRYIYIYMYIVLSSGVWAHFFRLRLRNMAVRSVGRPPCVWCRRGRSAPSSRRGLRLPAALRGHGELQMDNRNNMSSSYNMASTYIRILCGAPFYSGSKHNNIASRKTEVFLASAMGCAKGGAYFGMNGRLWLSLPWLLVILMSLPIAGLASGARWASMPSLRTRRDAPGLASCRSSGSNPHLP